MKNLETDNLSKNEYTMEHKKINILSLLFLIPIAVVILIPFVVIWGMEELKLGVIVVFEYIYIYVIIGPLIHEVIHALTWSIFTKYGLESVVIGMNWGSLSPYCHCKEPLKVKHYKIGVLMPLILMGVIPCFLGFQMGSGILVFTGMIFSWSSFGDIMAIYLLKGFRNNEFVIDHPDKMGFIMREKS